MGPSVPSKIDFVFFDNNDYEIAKAILEPRFLRAVNVHVTLIVLAAMPIDN